jgi:hypothetical protein
VKLHDGLVGSQVKQTTDPVVPLKIIVEATSFASTENREYNEDSSCVKRWRGKMKKNHSKKFHG